MQLKKMQFWAFCVVAAMALQLAGCATIPPPAPVLNADPQIGDERAIPVGRELAKITLPTYTIEPPDVLSIEVARVIPKSPYRIRPHDSVQVLGDEETLLPERPINGIFSVDSSGVVNIGPEYGKVQIGGLTVEEANDAVVNHLKRQTFRNPRIALSLSEYSGLQSITGQHTVGPDGTVSLGIYGSVMVTGLTKQQAAEAVTRKLSQFLEQPSVSLDVFQFASKKYTVITEGAGNGDNVQQFYCTGNETVIDAIAQINGLSSFSSKNIWIARPVPGHVGCDQILPVNWNDIVKNGNTATNYQIMPHDRIIVGEDSWLAFDGRARKFLSPFERMFNFTILGTQAVQTMNRFPTGQQ
jgi:polysaccharide export outer membrane protein